MMSRDMNKSGPPRIHQGTGSESESVHDQQIL